MRNNRAPCAGFPDTRNGCADMGNLLGTLKTEKKSAPRSLIFALQWGPAAHSAPTSLRLQRRAGCEDRGADLNPLGSFAYWDHQEPKSSRARGLLLRGTNRACCAGLPHARNGRAETQAVSLATSSATKKICLAEAFSRATMGTGRALCAECLGSSIFAADTQGTRLENSQPEKKSASRSLLLVLH